MLWTRQVKRNVFSLVVALSLGTFVASASFVAPGAVVGDVRERTPEPSVKKMDPATDVPVAHWATQDFPTNSKGMSYGSDSEAETEAEMPDLIAVVGDHGAGGFVLKSDLLRADGSEVTSPAQALAWQEEMLKTGPPTLDVYDVELERRIDGFTLALGSSSP